MKAELIEMNTALEYRYRDGKLVSVCRPDVKIQVQAPVEIPRRFNWIFLACIAFGGIETVFAVYGFCHWLSVLAANWMER